MNKYNPPKNKKEITYEIDENRCWNCTSHRKNKDGYPGFFRDGKNIKIYRYIYLKEKGAIPEGLIIRHTCDNPACINPAHLILGTIKDNARDRVERGRGAFGEKNGRNKITEEQAMEILKDIKTPTKDLANKYNLQRGTIYDIKRRKIWKHLNV